MSTDSITSTCDSTRSAMVEASSGEDQMERENIVGCVCPDSDVSLVPRVGQRRSAAQPAHNEDGARTPVAKSVARRDRNKFRMNVCSKSRYSVCFSANNHMLQTFIAPLERQFAVLPLSRYKACVMHSIASPDIQQHRDH